MEEKKKSEEEHRRYLRVPVLFPIRYEKVDVKKSSLSPDRFSLEGTVLDISGGGLKIHTNEEIKEGDYLVMKIPLSFIPENCHFFGQVRWTKKECPHADRPGHRGGIYFVKINRELQSKIVRETNRIKKAREKDFFMKEKGG